MEPEKKVAKPVETKVHPNQGLIDAEAIPEAILIATFPERLARLKAEAEALGLTGLQNTPPNSLKADSED